MGSLNKLRTWISYQIAYLNKIGSDLQETYRTRHVIKLSEWTKNLKNYRDQFYFKLRIKLIKQTSNIKTEKLKPKKIYLDYRKWLENGLSCATLQRETKEQIPRNITDHKTTRDKYTTNIR